MILPDNWSDIIQPLLGAVLCYAAILGFVRLYGLRSFAKMTAHDFAITVAIGSTLATAATAQTMPIAVPIIAIFVLLGMQYALSIAMRRHDMMENVLQNNPLLMMENGEPLWENLAAAQITENNLRSRLRSHGVTHRDQVAAVILETTGDFSILLRKSVDNDTVLDAWLMDDVSNHPSRKVPKGGATVADKLVK